MMSRDRHVGLSADPLQRHRAAPIERFSFVRNLRTALALFFHASPDGKPLRTFPGTALASGERPILSRALLDGLRSVAPRLGLVLLIAGALQMVLRLTGH